jgi:polar amino acid transport system permease protein
MNRFSLLFFTFFLSGCAGTYNFAWFSINPFHPQGSSNIEFLIGGLWTTIWISLVSLILAALVGLLSNSTKL